jgi:hypothetical protein
MTRDNSGAWTPILDAQTTRDELEQIINEQARIQLVDALVQIETLDLSQRERLAALVLVAPVISERTRHALTAGWQRLQQDAPPSGIH